MREQISLILKFYTLFILLGIKLSGEKMDVEDLMREINNQI